MRKIIINKNNKNKININLIFCFLFIILLINIVVSQSFEIPKIDKIQKDYKVIQNPDGTITIIAPENTEYNELNINGHEFAMFPGSKLMINKYKNEVRTEGNALITINKGKLNQNDLGIINDATIKLNGENNIIKAIFKPNDEEFIRDKEKIYDFDYKNKDGQTSKYIFSVRKGGKVVFDPENNLIEGEKTELSYEIKNQFGVKERQIIGAESFKLTLENGNPKQLSIEKGILKLNLFGGAQEFIGDRLTIFFDGRNIKDFEGNAISIDQTTDNRKINMKGQIIGNNLKGSLSYKGISGDTYTEFYYDGKPNKDGIQDPQNTPYFDVKQGIAELNNKKHKILIQDGRALLEIKNGNINDPINFKFETSEKISGFIDEENNKYQLIALKENRENLVTEISLDTLNLEPFIESEQFLARETQIKNIKSKYQDALSEIKEQINSGELTKSETQQYQLAGIITQNKLDVIEQKDIINSKLRLENFLKTNLYPEIKANAQIILGELRLEELKQLKASYGSPLAQTISEKARDNFRDAINYFDDQLKYPDLDEETKNRLINIRDQAQLNIGKSHLNDNRPLAEYEFKQLLESKLKETRSEANRLFGLSRFAQNPQGQSQFALQHLKKAIDENPNNILAKENLRDLELLLIKERESEYYKESGQQLQDVLNIIGEGSENKFLDIARATAFDPVITPYHALSDRLDELLIQQEQQLNEINKRIVGSSGIKSMIANGIEVNDYTTSTNRQRLSMISKLNGFDNIISSQNLIDYSEELKLGFDKSTRKDDISKLLARISQDKGIYIANKYFENLNKAMIMMDSVDFTIKSDPKMYLIGGHGNKLSTIFLGDESKLADAFTTDRSGNKIERSLTEFGLEATDIVAGTILTSGVTNIIGASTKTIGATRAFNVGRASLAPVETIVLNTMGKNAPKTAALLGIAGETITQTGISYGLTSINPEIGTIYDIVSLGGGTPGKSEKIIKGVQKISVISDNLGNQRLFLQIENFDSKKINRELLELGAREIDANLYSLNGELIYVGSNLGTNFKEVKEIDIGEMIDFNSLMLTDKQTAVQRILKQASLIKDVELKDLSDDEYFRFGKEIPHDEEYISRGFIDKNHYFEDKNKGFDQSYSYGFDDWVEWRTAYNYIEKSLDNSGTISEDLIKEIARRIPSKTANLPVKRGSLDWKVEYRDINPIPGGNYKVNFNNFYKEDEFLLYKNNPYIKTKDHGRLDEFPELKETLIKKYPNDARYIEENSDKIILGSVFYPKSEDVPSLMNNLIEIYNPRIANANSVDEIIDVAADFQRDFISIHPFRDGNGRTSRLLMDYILRSKGLPPAHLDDTSKDLLSLNYKEWREEVKRGVINAIKNIEGVAYYILTMTGLS